MWANRYRYRYRNDLANAHDNKIARTVVNTLEINAFNRLIRS